MHRPGAHLKDAASRTLQQAPTHPAAWRFPPLGALLGLGMTQQPRMCQSKFSSPPGCLLHSSTEQQPPHGQGVRAAGSAAPGPQLQLLGVCTGVLAAAASRSFSFARRSGPPSRCRPRAGAAPRPGSCPSSWPAELVLLPFSQCSRRSTSPGRGAAAGAVVGICSASSVPMRDLIAATAESHRAGPGLRREPRA